MFLRVVKRARTCHGSASLRGERCPVRGQDGQSAIDYLGGLALVVLIVGAVMLSTTQVAANVEAQLLCAVDSIGTEGGETGCGEPSVNRGPNGDEGLVNQPDIEALHMYQVTTEDGQVHDMELGGGGNQVDPSLGNTGGNQVDPSLEGMNEEAACPTENAETKGVPDPLIKDGALQPSSS